MQNVIKIAGFGNRLRRWIDILLNDFKSRVNHVGNLLREILLGRGARQGDPIATTLFVIAIEVLLIRIRTDKDVEPYQFFAGMGQKPIETKVDGYCDDLTLVLPRIERAVRAAMRAVESFAPVSGLKINKDKIREVIGPGGKMIREITENTGAKIDLDDDGTVKVAAVDEKAAEAAIKWIKDLTQEPEVGAIYDGKVVKMIQESNLI